MGIFDILGPVMVGPSSSHTAGAVRIGFITLKLLGEQPVEAQILLHGSYASTGRGHGTDRAIVAGLLGMKSDDENIPNSFEIAKRRGLHFTFGKTVLRGVHPNTALLRVRGAGGRELEVVASSPGGGRIRVCSIDGIETNFCGDCPTLIVHNIDQPGHVAQVTAMLAGQGVNIAAMQLYRNRRGGYAVMVVECDQKIPADSLDILKKEPGIIKVTYLNFDE